MPKLLTAGVAAVVIALTVGLGAVPASAEPAHPVVYLGLAGGSKVNLADGTVTSDLTAASVIQGIVTPAENRNQTAAATIAGLLHTSEVATSATADATGDTTTLVAKAHTAKANVLNGLITVKAVDTTSTASFNGSAVSANTTTDLVGIKITDVDLPINVPQNFGVNIPGVASIVLNYSSTYTEDGTVQTFGAGAFVTLLSAVGDSPVGTEIFLNPTYAAITAHIPTHPVLLGGSAYVTQLNVNALGVVHVGSSPTAYQALGFGGTNGQIQTNSVAAVNIPDVATTGVVTTTVQGSRTKVSGNARTTASVAGLNVFDGLITARAIKASAQVKLAKGGTTVASNATKFVGLVIAGQAIPVTVSPNTVIDVAGLGTVTLNAQYGYSFATNTRAILIKLTTARAGLPVGATIEIGFASAFIIS